MKEYVLCLEDYSKATFLDNFAASIAGAVASITISAPADVIKTRIQSKVSTSAESGFTIVRNMLFKEGIGSFFKVSSFNVGINSKTFGGWAKTSF